MMEMEHKRISIFCGHYGSGKTNIAVNFALELRKTHDRVSIIDLDIVNPYFRTKDSQRELDAAGVELISSDYAGSNLDIPALPAAMMRPIAEKETQVVMDIGGDDQGAVALGRFADQLIAGGDYDMFFVLNLYRPLTQTAEDALSVMREIEAACGLRFTAIVHNSNLGAATTLQDVLDKQPEAKRLCALSGLPLKLTTVRQDMQSRAAALLPDVFGLRLQKQLFQP